MAAAWTEEVRQRALEVEFRCVRAHQTLVHAPAHFAPAFLVAEKQEANFWILVGTALFWRVSDDLRIASIAMTTAEVLALRGAAADPTTPLPSIEHIPDGNHNARLVLCLFQRARYRTIAAHNSVDKCKYYLHMLNGLLIGPGFRGQDIFLEVLRVLVTENLEAALASSRVSAALAVVANWLAR